MCAKGFRKASEGRELLRELWLPTPWDTLLESYIELFETLTEEI
jgi:hypothetical protein